MHLFADAENLVRAHLDQLGVPHVDLADMKKLLHEVLKVELKGVRPQPRSVHRSSEFDRKLALLPTDLQSATEAIIEKTRRGEDLAGHLSRKSVDPATLDGLLADWSVHHLHISIHKSDPTDDFFARTGPLMFVFFSDQAAYFTAVEDHDRDVWTRQEHLEIIWRTWPDVMEPYRLKGVLGTAYQTSDPQDLALLRKGRVNYPLTIDGHVFVGPGGGLTTSGLPLKVGRAADKIMDGIRDLERTLGALTAEQRLSLADSLNVPLDSLDFEIRPSNALGWGLFAKGSEVELFSIPRPFVV
jgi:hypothetical protein